METLGWKCEEGLRSCDGYYAASRASRPLPPAVATATCHVDVVHSDRLYQGGVLFLGEQRHESSGGAGDVIIRGLGGLMGIFIL